ncbi:hemerythrin domain-containing protein [Spirillospora sp. CA-294931]|uniref:hemerythrin domain-containing protein n=1 Tax=Spirillospora sp. CA-294931 TaxID=3240042 RepID=UPI003D89D338
MERPDTHEMVVVHRVFRREFRLAAELVREAGADPGRAAVLTGHVLEYLDVLHHHHAGEDELLWPPLRHCDCGDPRLFARMEEQHERIAEQVTKIRALLPTWPAGALADALDDLGALIEEHLDEEERYVLPLAADHLSVAQWNRLGERGLRSIPRRRRLIVLGAILEDADPEEAAAFLARLPLVPRLLWRLTGPRGYRREIIRIRA